jgi:hypothetical protein
MGVVLEVGAVLAGWGTLCVVVAPKKRDGDGRADSGVVEVDYKKFETVRGG